APKHANRTAREPVRSTQPVDFALLTMCRALRSEPFPFLRRQQHSVAALRKTMTTIETMTAKTFPALPLSDTLAPLPPGLTPCVCPDSHAHVGSVSLANT